MSEWTSFEAAVAIAQKAEIPNARELLKSATERFEIEVRQSELVKTEPDGTLFYDGPDIEVRVSDVHSWVDLMTRAGALPAPQVQRHTRYASDVELVEEGRKGIADRRWPNAHAAAQELAPRAQGASLNAKVQRLRKKIANSRQSPNSTKHHQTPAMRAH